MEYTFITQQYQLEAFVERSLDSSVLAIDTEFLREKTYYPMLCLIQMATDNEVVLIDPFEVQNLHILSVLMLKESIVKVFHAATQDLEIINHEIQTLPWPVFDTQIAATLMGQMQQIGYANLIHAVCGVQLKKLDSYTDWSARPLTDSQLQYAAEDVIYLPQAYTIMKKQLESKRRLDWLEQDFRALVAPEKYQQDSRDRFRRLKRASTLTRKQLAAAREVAAWREERAISRNIPRKWVMTDEQIVEACKREAKTVNDLYMVRGMRERLPVRDARTVISLMKKGMALPSNQWPELTGKSRNEQNVDQVVDLMTALVRKRAKENDIAMNTLANHSDLVALARGYTDDLDILRGWRRKLVGDELSLLVQGKLYLCANGHEIEVYPS